MHLMLVNVILWKFFFVFMLHIYKLSIIIFYAIYEQDDLLLKKHIKSLSENMRKKINVYIII